MSTVQTKGTMMNPAEKHKALVQAQQALIEAHHELVEDPCNAAEGLDRAACPSHATDLARLAAGAASEGLTAERWRSWVVDGLGPQAGPSLDAAETCMRSGGLWPWPD